MDIEKAVAFLHNYPTWFRYAVAMWVLSGAGLLSGLVLLKNKSDIPTAPLKQTAPKIPEHGSIQDTVTATIESNSCPGKITFQQYADRYYAADGRFLIQQDLIESCRNTTIEWTGFVYSVTEKNQNVFVTLTLSENAKGMYLLAVLPSEFKTRAFSLRKNDQVSVRGTLGLSTPNFPDISAIDMQLINARSED